MSLRRILAPAVLAALLVPALSSCSRLTADGSGAASGPARDTLHLSVPVQLHSLNPLLATNTSDTDVASLAFDDLVVCDGRGVMRPDLVAAVPTLANHGISKDGKTVTFRLRRGVRWQDGAPFTSADVAFTFAKILDNAVNISSRQGYDQIVHVATPDAYTVVVKLKAAYAPFVLTVGTQYAIVPKHLLEHSTDINRDPFGTHPIGTGPYRFRNWVHGSRISYDANPSYFGGAPKIPHLTVSELPDANTVGLQLRTHEIDEASLESSQYGLLKGGTDPRVTLEPRNSFVAIALNTTSPLMSDVRVRRALSMAVDRREIVDKNTFGAGVPAYADLIALFWQNPEPANPYGYDPKRAAALLEEAGWKLGADGKRRKDGTELKIHAIDFAGSKTGQSIDLELGQSMQALGIDWTTKFVSASTYYASPQDHGALALGDYDAADLTFLANPDSQNDELYTCASREPAGFNAARYCSPEMDALQRTALTELDPARRAADVVKIERLAVTDVPYIFLYHVPARVGYNPALVRPPGGISSDWYGETGWSFDAR